MPRQLRCTEELATQEEAYDLITRLTAFAGLAVMAWAEDTDRSAQDVLSNIALSMLLEGET